MSANGGYLMEIGAFILVIVAMDYDRRVKTALRAGRP